MCDSVHAPTLVHIGVWASGVSCWRLHCYTLCNDSFSLKPLPVCILMSLGAFRLSADCPPCGSGQAQAGTRAVEQRRPAFAPGLLQTLPLLTSNAPEPTVFTSQSHSGPHHISIGQKSPNLNRKRLQLLSSIPQKALSTIPRKPASAMVQLGTRMQHPALLQHTSSECILASVPPTTTAETPDTDAS